MSVYMSVSVSVCVCLCLSVGHLGTRTNLGAYGRVNISISRWRRQREYVFDVAESV